MIRSPDPLASHSTPSLLHKRCGRETWILPTLVFCLALIADAPVGFGEDGSWRENPVGPMLPTVHVAPGVPGFMAEVPTVPPATHDVLVSPGASVSAADRRRPHPKKAVWQQHAQKWVEESPFRASMQREHHARRQVPGPMIPNAARRPVWKTPYSYGHFGATAKKQWTKSYGFHDRDVIWQLR